MGNRPPSSSGFIAKLQNDPRAKHVIQFFNEKLKRDPTPLELSRYINLGTHALKDIIETIRLQGEESKETERIIERSKQKKQIGVSIVSPYNKQCGISTYTENLYKHLQMLAFPCCVLSDETRNRDENSTELGVYRCWNSDNETSYMRIVNEAINRNFWIVHLQHEFGIFKDAAFRDVLIMLRRCGFTTIVTLHTVLNHRHLDHVYNAANLLVVHGELAASRLYSSSINNLTVIVHGTEDPLMISKKDSLDFVSKFITVNQGDILATAPGFISQNKKQLEIVKAIKELDIKNLKFLMIGSTSRRVSDTDYLVKLQEFNSDRISVVQKFLTKEEMAKILTASDFCIMNYEQTHYSTSGMSHLLHAYGVPSISSRSNILEDLHGNMSLKYECGNTNALKAAISRMCSEPGLRSSMCDSLVSFAKSTSWKKTAETHIGMYRRALEKFGS